jgi:hypothetical protein
MWAKLAQWVLTHVVLVVAKREADKAGVALFSEANALRVRQVLTAGILSWFTRAIISKRWAKEIKSDDQLAWFWQIVMKSDTIGERLGEPTLEDAKKFLKSALYEWERAFADGMPVDIEAVRVQIIQARQVLDAKSGFVPDKG